MKSLTPLADLWSSKMFNSKFNLKVNLLEYEGVCSNIKSFLKGKELPSFEARFPRKALCSIVIDRDWKGVSNLYKGNNGRNSNWNICSKWNKHDKVSLSSISVPGSLVMHNAMVDEIYPKYIQLRTSHMRFFTNNRLHKIGITNNPMCPMCSIEHNSYVHIHLLNSLILLKQPCIRNLYFETVHCFVSILICLLLCYYFWQ